MKSYKVWLEGWFSKKKPEDPEEDDPEMEDGYEHREDPDHPYCTNWPVNKKKGANEKV